MVPATMSVAPNAPQGARNGNSRSAASKAARAEPAPGSSKYRPDRGPVRQRASTADAYEEARERGTTPLAPRVRLRGRLRSPSRDRPPALPSLRRRSARADGLCRVWERLSVQGRTRHGARGRVATGTLPGGPGAAHRPRRRARPGGLGAGARPDRRGRRGHPGRHPDAPKGHHFPKVTLVAIVDGDQGLYGTDFRAGERMAQQLVQVAGRTGRAEDPGQVVIQTHHPHHPLLGVLLREGFSAFAAMALRERREAGLPSLRLGGDSAAGRSVHRIRHGCRPYPLVPSRRRWGALGDRSTTTVNISHVFCEKCHRCG